MDTLTTILSLYGLGRILTLLGIAGLGIWLMLPRGQNRPVEISRIVGGGLCALFAVLLCTLPVSSQTTSGVMYPMFRSLGSLEGNLLFYIMGLGTVASAIMMITSRHPVYSALWFAMVLLLNSGLYLARGAEFLSAATVIVYAGAIVVTFLFVIMLAQAKGTASYDRVSREPLLAVLTGSLLLVSLLATIHTALAPTAGAPVASPAVQQYLQASNDRVVADVPHVQGLGKVLFREHYVSIQLIGLLLLVAVAGALMVARHPVLPSGSAPQKT